MAESTKIQWCDHTFNPWLGCTKVAPGCQNCYAEEMMDTRFGKVKWGPKGTRSKTSPSNWKLPRKWDQQAECNCGAAGTGGVECRWCEGGCKRPRVFCASLADVFEDWAGKIHDHTGKILRRNPGDLTMDDMRSDLFELIDATPNLDWMLLTKRPENIRKMWPMELSGQSNTPFPGAPGGLGLPLPTYKRKYRKNVWLYTSFSEQETADRNIPLLLECCDLVPVLGVSAEPLLGDVDLGDAPGQWNFSGLIKRAIEPIPCLDHVIVGGESGVNARPCTIGHVRHIVEQCQAASVPVFVKQLGSNPINREGEKCGAIKQAKGGDPSEWPEDLQVREMPEVSP